MIQRRTNSRTRQRHSTPPRQKRPKVVIEHYSDGWTCVYSDGPIDTIHVDRPHVTTATAGVKVDHLVDVMLPPRFADVREPGNLCSWYKPTKVTPDDLLDRAYQKAAWNAVSEFGRSLRDGQEK